MFPKQEMEYQMKTETFNRLAHFNTLLIAFAVSKTDANEYNSFVDDSYYNHDSMYSNT